MLWYAVMLATTVATFYSMNRVQYLFDDFDGGGRGFLGWVGYLFLSTFASLLICLPSLAAGAYIGSLPSREGVVDYTYPLVALREKDGFQGAFFLGSGSIGSQEYYLWYRQNEDNSISGGKSTREPCVKIFQTSPKPSMTTYKTAYTDKATQYWLPFVGFDMREQEDWCPEFDIPPNSIQQGYSL